jgi:DNA helicase II / ATP-dependent DNA helicase PcrA
VVATPSNDVAWFRLLRLHEGIGPVHARRFLGALDPAAPGPLDRWPDAMESVPARSRARLAATIGGLASAARLEDTAGRAAAVLAALADPLRHRYDDADTRIADLQRLADAAASRPSLHDALVELALDPPVSSSDLAGPPRLDDDFLVISTVHSAKGLEWRVVHLPHLVDGAVPSDMALSSAAGLAEERRLFYVAVTRARDQLFLYAPLRMHHHRLGRDDRHSYAPVSRFLDWAAQAACDTAEAEPPQPVLPHTGSLTVRVATELGALFGD